MIAVKHQPATPLPWYGNSNGKIHYHIATREGQRVAEIRACTGPNGSTIEDVNYIAHAANAYPKLVEWLHAEAKLADEDHLRHLTRMTAARCSRIAALLRELGEAS